MVYGNFFLLLKLLEGGLEFLLAEFAAEVKALHDGPFSILAGDREAEVEPLRNSIRSV